VRNVSLYINDDIVFLYGEQSLRAKNNYETSDGIGYLGRRRNWWVLRLMVLIHFKLNRNVLTSC